VLPLSGCLDDRRALLLVRDVDDAAVSNAPRFLGKVRLVRLEHPYGWALQQPLTYRSALPGVGELVVPAGFVSDLESVSRWTPLLFALVYDVAPPAACVHDWLFRRAPVLADGTRPTRALADAIYREAMAAWGVPRWRRTLIWLGVRVGGWATWRRYRRGEGRR
jgi:hypothetical protein